MSFAVGFGHGEALFDRLDENGVGSCAPEDGWLMLVLNNPNLIMLVDGILNWLQLLYRYNSFLKAKKEYAGMAGFFLQDIAGGEEETDDAWAGDGLGLFGFTDFYRCLQLILCYFIIHICILLFYIILW